jgi:hypothetical protein
MNRPRALLPDVETREADARRRRVSRSCRLSTPGQNMIGPDVTLSLFPGPGTVPVNMGREVLTIAGLVHRLF